MTCWTQIGRVTLIRLLCYVWLLFYILSSLLYWILDFVIIYALSATLLGLIFNPVSMKVQDSWITLSACFALSLLALEEKAQTLPDATSPIAKIHPFRQFSLLHSLCYYLRHHSKPFWLDATVGTRGWLTELVKMMFLEQLLASPGTANKKRECTNKWQKITLTFTNITKMLINILELSIKS